MNGIKSSKINYLLGYAPKSQVLTATWLREQGYSGNLITLYCHHGWLKSVGHGAYVKVGEQLTWEGALAALQSQLKLPIHLGGQTALAAHGTIHFVPFRKEGDRQYLFNDERCVLPKWFVDNFSDHYTQVSQALFAKRSLGLSIKEVNGARLFVSSRERSVLEILSQVPKLIGYEHSKLLMESLLTLIPERLQELLECCTSIKAKRLFLHLAELNNLPCVERLDITKIDLGSGKRVIEGGGHYDSKYQLSVPIIKSDEDLEALAYV